jgi:thiol:disulfide interchange protein
VKSRLTLIVITGMAALLVLLTYVRSHRVPKNDGRDVSQTKSEWLTDFATAQQRAQAENKPLLIDFTGSDWCPPCELLERDVFSQREFADYAVRNLVLLRVDFPHGKSLSAAQQEANDSLAQRFYIQGFPTILALGPEGKLRGQIELGPLLNPAKFITNLEAVTKKPR